MNNTNLNELTYNIVIEYLNTGVYQKLSLEVMKNVYFKLIQNDKNHTVKELISKIADDYKLLQPDEYITLEELRKNYILSPKRVYLEEKAELLKRQYELLNTNNIKIK